MFKNDMYITRGIKEQINKLHYLFILELIDDMQTESKDFIQEFVLTTKDKEHGLQEIIHIQEEPPYRKSYEFYTANLTDNTVYVLDLEEYSIMMIEQEYIDLQEKHK